jgi:hypothetical protein
VGVGDGSGVGAGVGDAGSAGEESTMGSVIFSGVGVTAERAADGNAARDGTTDVGCTLILTLTQPVKSNAERASKTVFMWKVLLG